MSQVRQINDLFSPEAKSVRFAKTLIEFYKSSDPHVKLDLEPGLCSLVSAIQKRLEDAYLQQSLETFLAEEGMAPVMARWELQRELENQSAARSSGKV
jgi:transposase